MQQEPFCIMHKEVVVPDIAADEETAKDTLLEFQGGRVTLSYKSHMPSVLRILSRIAGITDELVVESPEGVRYLTPIYSRDRVIRNKDIVTEFAFTGLNGMKGGKNEKPYTLQAEELFPHGEAVSPESMREFFEALSNRARPVPSVTITGDMSFVPLLFTIFLLRGISGTVSYDDGTGTLTIF